MRRAKAVAAEYGVQDWFPEARQREARLRELGLRTTMPEDWKSSWKEQHSAWEPFALALRRMGFSDEQIRTIGNWRPAAQ